MRSIWICGTALLLSAAALYAAAQATAPATPSPAATALAGNEPAAAINTAINAHKAQLPLDVKNYGALGDGNTNDTVAVAAAIRAAEAGGTVLFPKGTYMVDPMTITTAAVTLRGLGAGVSIIKNRGTTGQHLLWVKANNVTICDLTIDGQRSAQSANTGTTVIAGDATGYSNFTIRNCEVKGHGFNCIATWNINGARIHDNYVWDNWDGCIDILEGSRNVSVVGNRIVSTGRYGVTCDTIDIETGGYVRNVTVQGNTIVMDAGSEVLWGIVLLTCERVTVTGNTIDCSTGTPFGGIRLVNGTTRVTIVGNSVIGSSGCTDDGISIDATNGADKRTSIIGNVVTGFSGLSRAGIANNYGNKVSIIGNQVSACSRGIVIEATKSLNVSELVVSGNQVDGGAEGIRFNATGGAGSAAVKDNQVTGTSSFNYVFGAGWTVDYEGQDLSTKAYRVSEPRRLLTGTATWDPPSVAAGAQTMTTLTVNQAAVGEPLFVGFDKDLQGMQLTGYVSAAHTVTVVMRNGTGGAIDLTGGTVRADVRKH